MKLNNNAYAKLLDIPYKLMRRRVTGRDEYAFDALWLTRLIKYFENDQLPAQSVRYAASVLLEGEWRDAEIEITRDGDLAVRLDHDVA